MADNTEYLAKARSVCRDDYWTGESWAHCDPCTKCKAIARAITEAVAGVERERDEWKRVASEQAAMHDAAERERDLLRAALEELLNEVDDVWLEETPGMRSGRTALQGEYSVTFNMGSHTVGQAYHKSHFAEADSACPVCRGDEPPALQGE